MTAERTTGPSEPLGSLHRGLASDGAVRFLAVEARALAEHVRRVHHLGTAEARLAAEAAVAALFLSAYIKGDERLTLQIQAEIPRFSFMADITADGGIRARMSPSRLAERPVPERLRGALLAINSDASREIYRGVTLLEDQTIEQALANHLRSSSQVDTVIRFAAGIDDDGTIGFAGGILVERLPDERGRPSLSPEDFARRYAGIGAQPVPDILVALAFGKVGQVGPADAEIELLENRVVRWQCSCGQERIENVLRLLGAEELAAMLEEDRGAEVVCHFCNLVYRVSEERLGELLSEVTLATG